MIKNKTCTACGTNRKAKTIVFHPTTFDPYCVNPYLCNEEHPNSAVNLIKRGSQIDLISFDEVQNKYKEYLDQHHAPDASDRIRKLLTNPVSVRIGSVDIAEFLLDLAVKQNLANISEAIRYCIQVTMDSNGQYYKEKQELSKEKHETQKLQETIAHIEEQDDEDMVF